MVLGEHSSGAVTAATRSAITAAAKVGSDVTVLVAGSDADQVVPEVCKIDGVTKVIVSKGDASGFVAESMAPLIVKCQEKHGFSHIFAGATAVGKNVLPRVAGLLDASMISEIIGVESEDTFKRTMYAGNAVCMVKSNDSVKIATVRATNFDPAGDGNSLDASAAESVDDVPAQDLSKFVEQALSKSDRPSLDAASRIVSGGRGMKDGDNFEMLYKLADKLGGAVGASRAAVDAGFCPNELQIGQTGKIVAPELYIAVGISGAIQHMAGMKDSKVIVAINKDPEAPIMQVADYGLGEDLFKAVPELTEKV